MNSKLTAALCGGLMFGVSVPILIAGWGKFLASTLGVVMLLSGALLVYYGTKTTNKLATKILLAINSAIASTILLMVLFTNKHIFLICWSVLMIILAVISWRAISNQSKV